MIYVKLQLNEAHYRNVIERNTQLEIDLRNAGEDQRAELARELARGRAEIERLQRDRDSVNQRRTTAEKQVEGLRRTIERLERQIDTLCRNAPEKAGEIQRVQGEIERLEAENERIRENMSLKDRIKEIFKKHGFTAVVIITAVSNSCYWSDSVQSGERVNYFG